MRYVSIFIAIISAISRLNSQVYVKEPTPNWVKEIKLDTISLETLSAETNGNGYNLAVSDLQFNLSENIAYTHKAIKVVSYSGITEASQLTVAIDTSYEKLKIHHLYIWRKGKKIDRTQDLSFKILNNEDKLADGLYYGKITVYSNLDDIRKDDVIDFGYSTYGINPIFNDEKFLFMLLEDDFKIDFFSIRVLYNSDKEYKYDCTRCDSAQVLSSKVEGNYKILELMKRNTKKLDLENNLPPGFIPCGYFTVSSINSWREVGEWAKNVFNVNDKPHLDIVFKELFDGTESQENKINKLLNYVQDEIRYMGIESGIGSIKPFHPDTVVKRRFGDCKDKSNLFVHLLRHIGIEKSYPVLVNTTFVKELANLPPSNQVFDHCIVRFEFNDTVYYIDPTISQQGGDFRRTGIFDYGKVLVVGLESDSLISMSSKKNDRTYFKDEFFIKSFMDPVILEMQSKRFGLNADMRRMYIQLQPKDDATDLISKELRLKYTGIQELEAPNYIDSIDKNEITCKYKFSLDKVWKDGNELKSSGLSGHWYYHFEPLSVYQLLNDYDCSKRKNNYGLPYPFEMEYEYIFNFPKEILIMDDYKKWVTSSYTIIKRTRQLSANRIEILYNYSTNKSILSPLELVETCNEKEKIANELPTVFYFKK